MSPDCEVFSEHVQVFVYAVSSRNCSACNQVVGLKLLDASMYASSMQLQCPFIVNFPLFWWMAGCITKNNDYILHVHYCLNTSSMHFRRALDKCSSSSLHIGYVTTLIG